LRRVSAGSPEQVGECDGEPLAHRGGVGEPLVAHERPQIVEHAVGGVHGKVGREQGLLEGVEQLLVDAPAPGDHLVDALEQALEHAPFEHDVR
jgi:hypothetical protein